MGVPFKKIARKNPLKKDAAEKFYPQLVTVGNSSTLDDIAFEMKDKSSLSIGDIQSVLCNFVEAAINALYNGKSVNIRNFGVFSLSARTEGVEKIDDCTAKKIKAVKINFRPSTTVRPDITATRAGQKIEFYDLQAALEKSKDGKDSGSDNPDNGTGGNSGSGDGKDDDPLG
jgi:DNA-binding protein, histone-like, putative